MKSLSSLLAGVAVLSGSVANALDVRDLKGEKSVSHYSPRGVEEKCVVPQKWAAGVFSKGDYKKETKLCEMDFYNNMGVCPKYNSTNPGILLIEPKGSLTATSITSSNCDDDDYKTEAKFKQSVSCSYTPSILAYYQLSRLLNDAGRVPVAVIRTMDIKTHAGLTAKAQRKLRGSDELIAKTWATFNKVHANPRGYPSVVDESQSQVYGALVQNVKGEYRYTEVSGRGSYETRYQRFIVQKPFQNVASRSSVTQIVGSASWQKVAPVVVQMKDVSDMVLMDTLLNQADRIGNIHYKYSWYYLENGKLESQKSETEVDRKGRVTTPAAEQTAMAAKGGVLIREMYLKDNDCGVRKDNKMREFSVLEKVRHMSYETYGRFMKLARSMELPETKDYFKRELLFTSADYDSILGNAKKAQEILYGNCRSGALQFDVDIQDYLPGAVVSKKSCEI